MSHYGSSAHRLFPETWDEVGAPNFTGLSARGSLRIWDRTALGSE